MKKARRLWHRFTNPVVDRCRRMTRLEVFLVTAWPMAFLVMLADVT